MSDPDTIVALTLAFTGGVIAALGYVHHPTWCRWVRTFRRRDGGMSAEDIAHSLVAHAVRVGRAEGQGYAVEMLPGPRGWRLRSPSGVETLHPTSAALEEAIVRRLRAGGQ